MAAGIHEEATWFCSRVGSIPFFFFSFFLILPSPLTPHQSPKFLLSSVSFFWKGRCSYVLNLYWFQVKKKNVIVALLQLKDVQYLPLGLRRWNVAFLLRNLAGMRCWNLQCIDFFIDSLSCHTFSLRIFKSCYFTSFVVFNFNQ